MFWRDTGRIAGLAATDLAYEWVLSLCMILALGAVFSPLFILLGLREGVVGGMLDELRRDPESRLVMPRYPVSRPLPDAWLSSSNNGGLAAAASVVIASRTGTLLLDVEGADDPVNALPSVPDDPLLVENGLTLDGDALEVVLSARLSIDAGKAADDRLEVRLIRNTGREEQVPLQLRVAGVMPGSEHGERRIWLPLSLFEDIDRWRDGQAVPRLDLGGAPVGLSPEFDGAVTILTEAPSVSDYRRMLARRMLFSESPRTLAAPPWQIAETESETDPETEPEQLSAETDSDNGATERTPESSPADGFHAENADAGELAPEPGSDAETRVEEDTASTALTTANSPGAVATDAADAAAEEPRRQQQPVYALWGPITGGIALDDIELLVDRHEEQGIAVEVVPYVKPFAVTLTPVEDDGNRDFIAVILPQDPSCGQASADATPAHLCVVAASDAEIGSDAEAILSVATTSGGMLEIPVNATSSDEIAPGLLGLPRDLAGRINAARSRDVRYDPNTGQFNAVGAGARFFRAYAPEIDGLESVVETVRALGAETGEDALLEPVSRVEQVRRIREVSDALLKLYLLIALITGTSGIFAVAANVYAGVQRKRVDLAYLQLLGVHRLALVLFPTIKSLLLVVGAIALALMAYFSFDLVAADVFSGLLPEHTVLTRLDFTAAAALTGAILGAALIASLVAALAVLRVEPGNFIRE